MGVANTGHDGGDMPVLAVQRLPTLRIVPSERRKPALDRRHRIGSSIAAELGGCTGRDVEADDLRIGGRFDALPSAPTGKMTPVGGVGAGRVFAELAAST